MPVCSKCNNNTKGHPQPWGPNCTWDGQPVVAEDGVCDDNGPASAGGHKEPEATGTPGTSGDSQEQSLHPDGSGNRVGLRPVEGRDLQIQELQKKLEDASKLIELQNKAMEEKRKDDMIANLQAKLASMELLIKQNDQRLSSPSAAPMTPPAGPAVHAAAGTAPPAGPAAVPLGLTPTVAAHPSTTPVDASNAAYAAAVAASQSAQPGAARTEAPVAALGQVFAQMQQPSSNASPQAILGANPLTKALLEVAQSADVNKQGKARYLPHKFVLKAGVREAKSVENLSFAEFMHAYLRMLEAMYEDQEPMADRFEFIIRLVSEVTHTRWVDVRELYMLFEQEVLHGNINWDHKFEGQLEKTAYRQKSSADSSASGGKGGQGGHSSKGGPIAPCKDFNWKDACAFPDAVCKFKHICFPCFQKGQFKEHKGRECPLRSANQHSPNTRSPRM
mgnify:CR=1 FL=1